MKSSSEIATVNAEEAESRIRDLDFARQTIEQTTNEVLLQGGINALVRGNIQSEVAARLLGA